MAGIGAGVSDVRNTEAAPVLVKPFEINVQENA